MTVQTTHPTVADLLDRFLDGAAADQLEDRFVALVGAVWSPDGGANDLAVAAVTELVAAFGEADDERKGYLAVLLALLVESEYPAEEGPLTSAARAGLDRYLEALATGDADRPFTLALLYLVSHFPGDRDRVLASVQDLALDEHDLSRLDRGLQRLDLSRPDVGRVWPSPAIWKLGDEERGFDQEAVNALTPEQVKTNWDNDTRTVWAYWGMRAYWAVRNHTVPQEVAYPMPAEAADPPAPSELPAEAFLRHTEALRCASCRSRLDIREGSARCGRCATTYPITHGLLDLSAGQSDEAWRESAAEKSDDSTANLLSKLAAMPSMGYYYEAVLRPAFLRISGLNWGLAVTPADEDAYLAAHTAPVDGPVLDLAAGAGRWTEVVAQAVGTERLIAQDMGLPMLTALRNRLPEVPAVVASALEIPFDDASLGGVNCWNALQAFPEQADLALREIGRVLKPGGTFTMLTFRWADDPLDRYFQASHFFPSRPAGMLLFELDDIKKWLADAGLDIRHESGTGTFVFITAERRA
ncbi:class I SAM-dependent methyltransferase [Streptomyces sp. NPDC051567]|uniref:class I SAM-dependent methyltransferase n=1 Tax=Streptomyces sp. NPDC051567 TaxID=3365660 RepID=UPI0037A54ABD